MTTREAIYKTALEHIRDGSDAVCKECGWIGEEDESFEKTPSVTGLNLLRTWVCPKCGRGVEVGLDEIAAYALAQGEKGE